MDVRSSRLQSTAIPRDAEIRAPEHPPIPPTPKSEPQEIHRILPGIELRSREYPPILPDTEIRAPK
jgi:hypothetical protein